jgi:hypothetical protein
MRTVAITLTAAFALAVAPAAQTAAQVAKPAATETLKLWKLETSGIGG